MYLNYYFFNRLTTKNCHLGLLAVGALFFGMRSCEYLGVKLAAEKQTKVLSVRNVQFYLRNKKLDVRKDNPTSADYVAITFESQKNGEKLQTVIQHKSNRSLCPVRAWGSLISKILSYDNTDENTQVNYYESDGQPRHIQASDMISHLRATCMSLGNEKLGFHPSKVGTHSIRTSFAMQLHLAGVRDFTIMTMGRWKSLAFLRYIRPEVQQFSRDLSEMMTKGASSHFNVNHTRKNLISSTLFQRQQGSTRH